MTIQEQLNAQLHGVVRVNEPLALYTTYKIGGPADFFFEANSVEDIVKAVKAARKLDIPFFLLGGGSNILVGDKGFRGLVIRNLARKITIKGMKGKVSSGHSSGEVFVEADSGAPFNTLVRFTVEEGLQGIEMHLGLPGTVGGAVYMNSKWMKPPASVGDVVYQARILTPTNEEITVGKEYFRFQYGSSSVQSSGDIVLQVTFVLQRGNKDDLWKIANSSMEYRKTTQPQGVKTAGCVFKNISSTDAIVAQTPNHTTSSGFLIDHAGGKSLQVGDAEVSHVHANFIVNSGKATASDVVQLIDKIKDKVNIAFHVSLREEVQKIGEF